VKVSLRWLSEYVDLPDDPAEVAVALAALGHEVEGVELAPADWSGVTIAKVLEVGPHPDADRIRLCSVTIGEEPIPVVCGAWNFDAGDIVAWARPGAVLPGGFEIGVRDIRGVTSNGMICSERELGLGDDHEGILVLDPDAPVGSDFSGWVELPDTILDVATTPNRPDAMSMVGLARDLAAAFGSPLRTPDPTPATVPGTPSTAVEIADPSGCYGFVLRELQDVSVGRSPFWMRRRLRAAGLRPISNVVDVTNYVMLELGQPLHAFDADRVAGDRLVVRRATGGERLTTLDDVDRLLTGDDLVICDDHGPTSLAGTMGGARSEVHPGTSRVLLEAAAWDPPTILHMARRHGLRSEASARFERGVDPNLPSTAAARAAELMLRNGGGSLLEGVVYEVAVPVAPLTIGLDVAHVTRVLGSGFDAAEIGTLLESIGFGVSVVGDHLDVVVPTVRPDVTRPIDLVEEVARLHGYDRFPDRVPTGPAGGWTGTQRRAHLIRTTLAGAGLSQAVNLSFLAGEDLDAVGYPDDHEGRSVVRVTNPLREEESAMRTGLLAGLLRSLRYNRAHGIDDVALFEVGKVFFRRPSPFDARIPDQPDRVGFTIVGSFGPVGVGDTPRPVDVHTATALWRLLAGTLRLDDWELVADTAPGFHPGRTARVVVRGRDVGHVGEVHPRTAAAYGLDGRVAAAELDLATLTAPVGHRTLRAPSPFPPVDFDLAFVVPDAVPAAAVLASATLGAGDLLEELVPFDEYRGDAVGPGCRSLAMRVRLRATDRTLTNEDAGRVRTAIIATVGSLGATLRGAS